MKDFFKKKLPQIETLRQHPSLRKFEKYFARSSLGCFDRSHVAKGLAVGLFVNFLPIPLQMLWAFLLAACFHANLPIAIAATWINNPFTFVPINYFMYKVGTLILGVPQKVFVFPNFEWSITHFSLLCKQLLNWLINFGKPYILGVAVVSSTAAVCGFALTHIIWRFYDLLKKRP